MTDRELLEAAAKAAGYKLWWGITDPMIECREPLHPNKTHNIWNPLTDDGDALRLAVKLRQLRVHIDIESTAAFRNTARGDPGAFAGEPHGADPYAATRRAITRAAAEIGKDST